MVAGKKNFEERENVCDSWLVGNVVEEFGGRMWAPIRTSFEIRNNSKFLAFISFFSR